MLDREQLERVHDDRHAVRGADRLAVLDDPVHLVLGGGGLRECAYRYITVTIATFTAGAGARRTLRTLQEVQQPPRSRIARVAVLVLQILQQRHDVQLALGRARRRPFCPRCFVNTPFRPTARDTQGAGGGGGQGKVKSRTYLRHRRPQSRRPAATSAGSP